MRTLNDPGRALRINSKTGLGFDTNGVCNGPPLVHGKPNVDKKNCPYCYAVLPQKRAAKTGNWRRVRRPVPRTMYIPGELVHYVVAGQLTPPLEIAMNISSDFLGLAPRSVAWEFEMVKAFLTDVSMVDDVVVKARTKKWGWTPYLVDNGVRVCLSLDTLGFGVPHDVAFDLKKMFPGMVTLRMMARNPEEAKEWASHVDTVTLFHRPQGTPFDGEGFKELKHGGNPFKALAEEVPNLCCQTGVCGTCSVGCGFTS